MQVLLSLSAFLGRGHECCSQEHAIMMVDGHYEEEYVPLISLQNLFLS